MCTKIRDEMSRWATVPRRYHHESQDRTEWTFAVSLLAIGFFRRRRSESEILAKVFAEVGEKRGETLAKLFADFRPLISRKSGRNEFHDNSRRISRAKKDNSFTARLWELVSARRRRLGHQDRRRESRRKKGGKEGGRQERRERRGKNIMPSSMPDCQRLSGQEKEHTE